MLERKDLNVQMKEVKSIFLFSDGNNIDLESLLYPLIDCELFFRR